MFSRIFGPKRDELEGEWRKLHNEKLNDLYCTFKVSRVIESRITEWAVLVTRMGKSIGIYRVLVCISEGKRPLGRFRCSWEDIIKMSLQEV